jgi:hypothetical protein
MLASLAAVVDATRGALVRVPVQMRGAWTPEMALSSGWTRREWQGLARADEPLVAVLFARVADTIEWHKSDRPPRRDPADAVAVHTLDVSLGITAGPGQPLASLDARTHRAHANVTISVPGGGLAPAIPDQHATSTGVLLDLVAFDGTPRVTFALLFLAASQVKVGRNGLWHVRRALAPALHEPLRTILTRGRHGSLPGR